MSDAKIEVLEELIDMLGGGDILARLQKRAAEKKAHDADESAGAAETPSEESAEDAEKEKKPFAKEL